LSISVLGEKSTLISVPPRMVRDLTPGNAGDDTDGFLDGPRHAEQLFGRAPSDVPVATIVTRAKVSSG